MFASKTSIGWKAKDFALKEIDDRTYTLAEVRGPKARLLSSFVITAPT